MTKLSFCNQTRTLLYTFTFLLLVSTYTPLAKCEKIKTEFRTEKCKKVMKRNSPSDTAFCYINYLEHYVLYTFSHILLIFCFTRLHIQTKITH